MSHRQQIISTTTDSIEGHRIVKYIGVVTGESIIGSNFIRDISANVMDVVGGQSTGYEKTMRSARTKALEEMEAFALEYGANAIVGIDLDYQVLGKENAMMMCSANGTAVIIE